MYAKSIILVTLLLSFSEAKEFRFNTNGALCDHFGQCPSTGELLNKLNSYSTIQVSSFPIQVDKNTILKIHPKRKVYKSDIDLIELLENNDFSSLNPRSSKSCLTSPNKQFQNNYPSGMDKHVKWEEPLPSHCFEQPISNNCRYYTDCFESRFKCKSVGNRKSYAIDFGAKYCPKFFKVTKRS